MEALCGFQRPVTHLDGRQLLVTSIPGEVVAPNSVRIVREQGLPQFPNSALYGDLIVAFKVDLTDGEAEPEWTERSTDPLLLPPGQISRQQLC